MKDISALFNAHPRYIESLYRSWQNDPASVEADWALFFKGFDFALSSANGHSAPASTASGTDLLQEFAVYALIQGYRQRGHLLSTTNPIKPRRDRKPRLDLSDYGLSEGDLDRPFAAGFEVGLPNAPLRDIVARLKKIYCGNLGFEFAHIYDYERRKWLQEKIEHRNLADDFGFSIDKKRRILEKLNGAVVFEQFLHTKFVGQKRFSLEGGEATIPALDAIIQFATKGDPPVEEIVIGMAHRGRLNVLANILGKTYEQIFTEFESKTIPDLSFGDGDVKYHLGFSSQIKTLSGREVYVKLLPNPSHLEAVDPVVLGFTRAKADALYNSDFNRILPILIHGDAALAGQGIVYEIAQMSQLPGYYTGGTIHFVINNQIGFTTNWDEGRSSVYCTQVADVVQAPVIHVNGDDPEAVVFAVELATEYRQKFHTDVYIDMVCYRRYGHNESDEPRFTQPDLYTLIANHPNPREVYNARLVQRGDVDAQLAREMERAFRQELQARLDNARQNKLPYTYQETELAWKALSITTDDAAFQESPPTGIPSHVLERLLKHLLYLPEDFEPLPQISKMLENQRALVEKGQIDWALGELLAYGSILLEGKDVRMSGQDVKRGTFSHRHACPVDAKTYRHINRLDGIAEKQGRFLVYNSLLSEYAVLGFEYGYAYANPDALVIWEAQFGDFANGASTIIDQFILAAEAKWRRMNGLVLLLPHGYEGQGPEHSSARLERYLQGCAGNNVTVANVTSASNFFHLLRRQMARPFRKPLIVMSPKSTLRPPYNMGLINELTEGNRFREILDDSEADPSKTKRLLVCSGKVYYDLRKRQQEEKRTDVAIVRLEQIYPFPKKQFEALLQKYSKAKLYWVQEEPFNMGAWSYLLLYHREYGWTPITRPAAASPATGFATRHEKEQAELIEAAFRS
ncbi:MAG: 2-oxoglutarate dehydrogenase E1 component [Saprospiraceae bacterium]|nr:2-oxoglutarate dehydrogenase E1 component [Saprospiraceae bacterium]MDW8485071.1 2-oxoglutarate dehydrogenase E1 component [Saprospiraceae bacterium]